MSEQELRTEIRRGLLIIIRALMKRYAMTWLDFIPADDRANMTFTAVCAPDPSNSPFITVEAVSPIDT